MTRSPAAQRLRDLELEAIDKLQRGETPAIAERRIGGEIDGSPIFAPTLTVEAKLAKGKGIGIVQLTHRLHGDRISHLAALMITIKWQETPAPKWPKWETAKQS